MKEIKPLCVLDFYVSERVQRGGHGKQLFERMLQDEGVSPEQLAYDRPSPKLINFLAKHYGLKGYLNQSHHFVVFDAYFNKRVAPKREFSLPPQNEGPSYQFRQNKDKQKQQVDINALKQNVFSMQQSYNTTASTNHTNQGGRPPLPEGKSYLTPMPEGQHYLSGQHRQNLQPGFVQQK